MTMDRIRYAEAMRERAREAWSQATRAEAAGDLELAHELVRQAQEAEMQAMSAWPVNLSHLDRTKPRA